MSELRISPWGVGFNLQRSERITFYGRHLRASKRAAIFQRGKYMPFFKLPHQFFFLGETFLVHSFQNIADRDDSCNLGKLNQKSHLANFLKWQILGSYGLSIKPTCDYIIVRFKEF